MSGDGPTGLMLAGELVALSTRPSHQASHRPAIEHITTDSRVPQVVTADRGYWDSAVESDLATAGVTTVVIPRTGKCSAARAPIEPRRVLRRDCQVAERQQGCVTHLKPPAR